MSSWIVTNSKMDLICRWLYVCVCVCGLLWRTGKGCCQVVVSGWWDVMDVFGQRSANSALLHYHHPVSLLHSQTHTGVFPLTHYTIETNHGWTTALITFLSVLHYSLSSVLSYSTLSAKFDLLHKFSLGKAFQNVYHLGNVTVSTL